MGHAHHLFSGNVIAKLIANQFQTLAVMRHLELGKALLEFRGIKQIVLSVSRQQLANSPKKKLGLS
jgi:hypothetical protein